MELEKLVITELENMDLDDIKIHDLLCDDELTLISFEKDAQLVDFTIQKDGSLYVTELIQDGLVYTDEEIYSGNNDLLEAARYVRDVVKPIIEKYQNEIPLTAATSTNSQGDQNQNEEMLKMIAEMKQEIEELKLSERERNILPKKKSATRKEKILSIAGSIAFYFILVTVIIGVALFGLQEPGAAPRSWFGYSVMTVLSGSMEPTIPQRSLVVLRTVDANTLEVGDIVTYLIPNNRTITHRITEIIENYQGGGMRGFRLQGDNNLQEDVEVIWSENVIGEIIYANLLLGQIVFFIQEYIILIVIFIVLFAALVFVIKKFFLTGEDSAVIPVHVETDTGAEMVKRDDSKKRRKISKDHVMLLVIVVIAGVFSYSVVRVLMIGGAYRDIEIMSASLREDYTQILMPLAEEDDLDLRELLSIDWENLHERNEDIIAWVDVPGTNINYPILAGATNEEYLSLDIDRQHSIAGSIFLEENNEPTFLDLNTIIYGHNMANGSKFSDIDGFVIGEITVDDAPYIYLYLPEGTVNIYRIVGARLTDIYSEIYHLPVVDLEDFYELMLAGNVLDVSFDKDQQRVLTLSTCAELGVDSPLRSVIFAVLIEEVDIRFLP